MIMRTFSVFAVCVRSARCLAGALIAGAVAAGSPAGLLAPAGAAASGPVGAIGAGPRLQTASASAGASVTFMLDVRNFNEHDVLPVSFQLADLDSGGLMAPPQQTPYTLVGLATLPEPFILTAGELRRVPIVVRSDGRTHYAAIVVVGGPPGAPFARIVLKVVLTPPHAKAEPDVRLMPAPSGTITLDFTNSGEGLMTGRGVLFFSSPDGRFLGRLDVPPVAVLPHGSSSLRLQWPETLPSGTVARAVLTLDGSDAPFVASATVP